jgi:hypothetical protein
MRLGRQVVGRVYGEVLNRRGLQVDPGEVAVHVGQFGLIPGRCALAHAYQQLLRAQTQPDENRMAARVGEAIR